MHKLALFAQLEARPGKEDDVAELLGSALPMAQDEEGTNTWFALRMAPTIFGMFDTFSDGGGREAHLSGAIAAALMEKVDELLAEAPRIHKVDVLAAKA